MSALVKVDEAAATPALSMSVANGRAQRLSETVRNARLSELCWAERVRLYSRTNFAIEVFIAIVSSSAVGGWALWHDDAAYGLGQIIWKSLSAVLVIATIIKPMLKLQDRIKSAAERMSEYHGVYVEALQLADDVRANRGFYSDDVLSHETLLAKKLPSIESKSSEEEISIDAARKWQAVVRAQYPKTYFWFPKGRSLGEDSQAAETSRALDNGGDRDLRLPEAKRNGDDISSPEAEGTLVAEREDEGGKASG